MILLAFFCFESEAIAQTYSGGSGTENDPYLISSNADMVALANAVNNGYYSYNKYFLLTRDLAGITTMIGFYGSDYVFFKGTFDGGGHSLNVNNGVAVSKIVKE